MEEIKYVHLRDLKVGDFFTFSVLNVVPCSSVWIRGNYVRSLNKYSCTNFNDSCKERFVRGDKLVRIDFEF